MPNYRITFTREIEIVVEADSLQDVLKAAHNSLDDIDNWDPDDWNVLNIQSTKDEAWQGIKNERIVHIDDVKD